MAAPESDHRIPLCPSAQPDWNGATAFGVVAGSARAPRTIYLTQVRDASEDLMALAHPVAATEVFRFAGSCLCGSCKHFSQAQCTLATKIARRLEAVVEDLPSCAIRPACRWYIQEGAAVCFRCPQVVTDNTCPSETMRALSEPSPG